MEQVPSIQVAMNLESSVKDEKVVGEILIFVAGILVAMLVDGAIIHETGHSGGEWVDAVLDWSDSVWAETAEEVYLKKVNGSYKVTSFITADGNECVSAPSGGFVCKYSLNH